MSKPEPTGNMREQVKVRKAISWDELCLRKLKLEIINELKPIIVEEVLERLRTQFVDVSKTDPAAPEQMRKQQPKETNVRII